MGYNEQQNALCGEASEGTGVSVLYEIDPRSRNHEIVRIFDFCLSVVCDYSGLELLRCERAVDNCNAFVYVFRQTEGEIENLEQTILDPDFTVYGRLFLESVNRLQSAQRKLRYVERKY